MKVPFRPLALQHHRLPRPVVDVYIEGISRIPIACLVDTGALVNRFGLWVARAAGIDLGDTSPENIGIGGRSTIARTVPVRLALGDFTWEAPASFCDPWPWDFNLLGQEGFLRFFKVTLRAANRFMEITPERG